MIYFSENIKKQNPLTDHKVWRANKYKLRLTNEQEKKLVQFCGSARFIYNLCLRDRLFFEKRGSRVGFYAQCKKLTQLKSDPAMSWLCEAPIQALQQALKDLDKAFVNHRKKPSHFKKPTVRKKYRNDTIRFLKSRQNEIRRTGKSSGQIRIQKIGWVSFRGWYGILGNIRSITIKRDGCGWAASVFYQSEVNRPTNSNLPPVGIDVGITHFAALSTGELIDPLNAGRKSLSRLAFLQRRLARKNRGSNNWRKQKRKITKLHASVVDARRDFLHKLSTRIAKNHGLVCVENLKIKNMSASARGSVQQPGRNVKAKSGLNRSILDQGWSMFMTFSAYKLDAKGGWLEEVPAPGTSLHHWVCGEKGQRKGTKFYCPACDVHEHADVNAAKNILRRGSPSMPVEERCRASNETGTVLREKILAHKGVEDVRDLHGATRP